MPVQINEIIIKAVVDSTSGAAGSTGATTDVNTDPVPYTDALDKLLEILKEKNER